MRGPWRSWLAWPRAIVARGVSAVALFSCISRVLDPRRVLQKWLAALVALVLGVYAPLPVVEQGATGVLCFYMTSLYEYRFFCL